MHVTALKGPTAMSIHLSRTSKVQGSDVSILATLKCDKALIEIRAKYTDYADVFSLDLAMELLENTGMNKHAIELIDGKQLPYEPIYALCPVELETLKIDFKTHLKTGFI